MLSLTELPLWLICFKMELGNSGESSILPHISHWDFDLFAKIKLPFRGVRCRTRQAIIAAVEQSVRRLVQEDSVNAIRRLPDVWRRVFHIGGDYF